MKANNSSQIRSLKPSIIGFSIVSLFLLVSAIFFRHNPALHQRQAEVALIGSQVMPFDLEATTHKFELLPDGGLQTVTADNPTDERQIELIQTHLQEESAKFRAGDFSDPATIHGDDMPGLLSLRANFNNIDVQYAALPDSGQIYYVTDKADSISALHAWFDAQRSDHGHQAR